MEFRSLRYFMAIVRAGSFSRAAEDACVTQPALSQAIRLLEQDLRCQLFLRGRSIALTPAGERLRDHCRKIFPLLEDVRDDLAQIEGGVKGVIRPAVLESLLLFLMPEVLSDFSTRFPQIRFQFTMKETNEIEKAVMAGENHFGLVSRRPASRGLDEVPLTSFPHVLVCARGLRGNLPTLLKKRPLFLLGEWQQEVVATKTDLLSRYPGVRVLNPINHVAVVRQLVARGLGLALLPGFVQGEDLRVLRTYPEMRMGVFLIRHPDRQRFAASERFMEFLEQAFPRSSS